MTGRRTIDEGQRMRDDPPPFCFRKMNREGMQAKDDMQHTIYDRLIEICVVFLVIFTPFAYGAVEPWSIAVFEITAALMFLFWIFKKLENGRLDFVRNPLMLFIFLFIFYVSIQLFFSRYSMPYSIYPWATKTELLKLISYALIFSVTLNTIKTREKINLVFSVIIAVGFLMSIFSLMRYFGAEAPRGIINPDHFSGYLGMIIPLVFGFLFIRDTARDKRFLLFFSIVVMGAALFFTMSRGGMFSFIAALLFMAVLVLTRKSIRKKGWILSAVLILIMLTVAWLGATPVIEKVLSIKVEIASQYFGGRLPVWQGTVDIAKDYPVFGTGLGTFNYIFPKYQSEKITKHYTYAHSDFLELFSEVGIVGFSIFLSGLIVFAGYGFTHFYKRYDPYVIGASIGIFGSLAGIFVHSLADFSLRIPANAILLIIILSLFLSLLNYKRNDIRLIRCELRNAKFILYPVAVLSCALFIIASARPAIADYFFQSTKSGKGVLSPYRGVAPTGLYALRDSASGIQNTKLAISLDPTNAVYHYQLGKLYSKGSVTYEIQYAINNFKKAVELNPSNSKYHQSLAWSYGQLADLYATSDKQNTKHYRRYVSLAHRHFQEAISLEPNNAYRHRTYAIWLFDHPSKENVKMGVTEYIKAVELVSGLTEESLTNYYKYEKNYQKLADILPGTKESDYKTLRFLMKEKGLKFAVDFAEKFFKTYPYNAKLHFFIADSSFYDRNYSWNFTEQHYRTAFKYEPLNAYYRMRHGILLYYRQEYKEALKELKMALELGLDRKSKEQAKSFVEKCKANTLKVKTGGNQKT